MHDHFSIDTLTLMSNKKTNRQKKYFLNKSFFTHEHDMANKRQNKFKQKKIINSRRTQNISIHD